MGGKMSVMFSVLVEYLLIFPKLFPSVQSFFTCDDYAILQTRNDLKMFLKTMKRPKSQ